MLKSAVGKKLVAAVTGLLLFGFVVLHMAGHLLVFQGKDAYNSYAEKLQSLGPIKWAARGGLLAIAAIHVYCTLTLARTNRAARPVGYQKVVSRRSSWFSRTMAVSGLVVLAFGFFHILHFTTQSIDGSYAEMHEKVAGHERHDTFAMMAKAFSSEWFLLIYVAAMLLLFSHLSHGIASLMHTLGLSNHAMAPWQKRAAPALAAALVAGFLIVPIYLYGKSLGKPEKSAAAAISTEAGR